MDLKRIHLIPMLLVYLPSNPRVTIFTEGKPGHPPPPPPPNSNGSDYMPQHLPLDKFEQYLEHIGYSNKEMPPTAKAWEEFVSEKSSYVLAKRKIPLIIETAIYVEEISAVSSYSFATVAELAMIWRDVRLSHSYDTIMVNEQDDINKLWIPPVFINNAEKVWIGDVVKKNQQVEVRSRGDVIYRARIQVTALCKMRFHHYPFDIQKCGLDLRTFGYNDDVLQLQWSSNDLVKNDEKKKRSIERCGESVCLNDQIELSNFLIHDTQIINATGVSHLGFAASMLSFRITLQRRLGFHMIYTFLPSSFMLTISWFTLWLDPTAVAGRVALCITSILTLQTLSSSMGRALPPTSYMKAMDVWMFMCSMFITLIFVEFIVTNYIARVKRVAKSSCKLSGPRKVVPTMSTDSASSFAEILPHFDEDAGEGDVKLSRKIDRYARILFAIVFTLMQVIFWGINIRNYVDKDNYITE